MMVECGSCGGNNGVSRGCIVGGSASVGWCCGGGGGSGSDGGDGIGGGGVGG